MSTFLWLDSTAWTAITALATALLVIVGGLTIISAGMDSRSKSRPYLVAEIRLGPRAQRMNLVITNYGASAAKNVQVELPQKFQALDTWAESAAGHTAKAMMLLKFKYAAPLPLVGPGQVETNTWIFQTEIVNSGNLAPSPSEEVVISYDKEGLFGRLLKRRYRDVFKVSYEARLHDTFTSSTLDLDQQMKEVIKHLGTIGTAIEAVSESIEDAHAPTLPVAENSLA
jgi:hypothetical protein